MLRLVKILLVASVAAWAFAGAFGNLTDWAGTSGAVEATTTMATFEGGADSWRATSNGGLILAGAIFIVVLKIASGLLCLAGVGQMAAARGADAVAFQRSKSLAIAGCALAVFMLFAGWIVIAETWFEAWRSDYLRDVALQSAFRYAGMIGVIALIVGMRED